MPFSSCAAAQIDSVAVAKRVEEEANFDVLNVVKSKSVQSKDCDCDDGGENDSEEEEGSYLSSEEDEEFQCAALRSAGTPAQLRSKIRKLLRETDVTAGEFQKMIGVSSNPYCRFMNGKYKTTWAAAENQTYDAAAVFFAREKKLGPRAVGKLRKTNGAKGFNDGKKSSLPDLSDIPTDHMTYLTPQETRQEIQKLFKEYKSSAPELARLAGGVSAQMVGKFIRATGPWGGKDMHVYEPLAHLMEKFRIATKKPKSKKRKGIDAEIAAGRVNRNGQPFLGVDPNAKFLCFGGERPVRSRDDLGRTVVKFQRCN